MKYFTNLQKNFEFATSINVKGNYDILLLIGENPNKEGDDYLLQSLFINSSVSKVFDWKNVLTVFKKELNQPGKKLGYTIGCRDGYHMRLSLYKDA